MRLGPYSAGQRAEQFLRRQLGHSPVAVAEIVAAAGRQAIARATLYRAAKRLRIERIPTGGGRYKWVLCGWVQRAEERVKWAVEETIRLIRAGLGSETAIFQACCPSRSTRHDAELMRRVRAKLGWE